MERSKIVLAALLFWTAAAAASAGTSAIKPAPSVAEIVSRNVAARGGAQAWKAVQSIEYRGKLGAGGNQRVGPGSPAAGKAASPLPTDPRPKEEVLLPFTLELQRPRRMRVELQFRGQTAVQVYDGQTGWKLRPYLNRADAEPFTAEENKAASLESELDGQLVDYAAKGTQVVLEGSEKVEDRDTYRLKLSLKNGQSLHIWVDAATYLETKIEGSPRRLDGVEHPVEIFYRNYRQIGGLQIPYTLETHVLPGVGGTHTHGSPAVIPIETIQIENTLINPKIAASRFTKPLLETANVQSTPRVP